MIIGPPKGITLPKQLTIYPQLVNISHKKIIFTPKYVNLCTFTVKMLQVAFTRFCRQIHHSARIGVRGWGSSQSWQCQDFETFLYGNPSLKEGYTPLLVAAQEGHTEVCELLLAAGSDVGERDKKGDTPLLVAAQEGHFEVCEVLLAAGSDVGERTSKAQFTPLHKAAGFGHERVIQLLLSYKADINSRSRTDATPLHVASQEGRLASVVILLQAGADPLLPRRRGALPITVAAQHNQCEVVKILIEQGGCSPDQVRRDYHQCTVKSPCSQTQKMGERQ